MKRTRPFVLALLAGVALIATTILAAQRSPADRAVSLPGVGDGVGESQPRFIGPGPQCVVDLRLYDDIAVSFLKVSHGFDSCVSPIPGVTVTALPFPHPDWVDVANFPPDFRGPATVLQCEVLYLSTECQATSLDFLSLLFGVVEARGADGLPLGTLTMCADRFDCDEWKCGPEGPYVAGRCGDPNRDDTISASDALFALQAAVSNAECLPEQCDTDNDGTIDASDALRILFRALGLAVDLACPFPCDPRTS
jgi:hypothetical protein